ncbi:hypothetical protein COV04_02120 [Candidatus Uhrbacteria bacterium CG10_big_fil_rev_8_21_14_0_10_48_11]|uniref:Uncharacterized protein n=1 Tax=Candidatus Uhrbacteria bacterium CG10_big_fil_rev_8_21_14_0_10_48_11 TaxID=1975037 RepID=A0A2M8LER2_9BACT|nr:MAG: hypothetical protein COV04_02120 [Candidatus Uhrbacteria bacterium CG10_big_fil_rev_8_21_14_0_10_48_11]
MGLRTAKIAITTFSLMALLVPPVVLAGPLNASCDSGTDPKFSTVLNRVACDAGLIPSWQNDGIGEDTLLGIVGSLVSLTLGFVGIVFAILTIYGGYLWMTARGNKEQVTDAQDYIRNSVIGIIIVLATFSLTQFVVTQLIGVVTQASPGL